MNFKQFFPIISWLPTYQKSMLSGDLASGITVGILLIPQGMAYAMIAGLPPVFGLYAALFPQVIYGLMGTSKQLSVGPVAMDSLLVAASLGALKITNIDTYIGMAVFLAFFMGIFQLLLGFLKMGFLVNFLSKPVISGFTSAAAIVIGLSQLKHVLGVKMDGGSQIQGIVFQTAMHIQKTHWLTLVICLVAIVMIVFFKKYFSKIPGALVVVVVGTLAVYVFQLQQYGVKIVGDIPAGFPSFRQPIRADFPFSELAPIALTLALVAFMETISVSKSLEEKERNYEVDANQELIALGTANVVSSFFLCYPTTGGFSRTAVNNQAGAQTGLSSIVSALIIGLTLLFLTPVFYYLPQAVLAAMILVAVYNLIEVKFPITLYQHRKEEFWLLIFTFVVTLILGIKEGIIGGVILSLVLMIYRTSKPHIAVLARIDQSNYFKNVLRFHHQVKVRPDLLIVRFDAQLYFGNKDYFKSEMTKLINQKGGNLKAVILSAGGIQHIDSSATTMLINLISQLQAKQIKFYIAGVIGPTRDIMYQNGLVDIIGKENMFVRTYEAVDCFDGIICKDDLQNTIVQQITPLKL